MSGRSYWDLLSSEPQVRWKARPALLWVLLQKSCTELSQWVQWDWTEWARIWILLIGSMYFFFSLFETSIFFIKDFHCAVPWPLPVLALLEEQLFAAWAADVVEVQNNERNRGWEVHLFLVAVLAGTYINRNDNIYKYILKIKKSKLRNLIDKSLCKVISTFVEHQCATDKSFWIQLKIHCTSTALQRSRVQRPAAKAAKQAATVQDCLNVCKHNLDSFDVLIKWMFISIRK